MTGIPVIDFTLAGVLLFASALAGYRLMRRSSPAQRHRMLVAAMALALALPAAVTWGPKIPILQAPQWRSAGSDATGRTDVRRRGATPEAVPPASSQLPQQVVASRAGLPLWSWRSVIVGVWVLGAILHLGFLSASLLKVRRKRREADSVTSGWLHECLVDACRTRGIERVPALHLGDGVPMAWGIWSTHILLPRAAEVWTFERVEAVFAHELEHVRRRDQVAILLANLGCAAHWLNPIAWVVRNKMELERELACDAAVVDMGIPPDRYAGELCELARYFRSVPIAVTGVVNRRSALRIRIEALLREGRSSQNRSAVATVCMLLGMLGAFLGRSPVAAPSADAPLQHRADYPGVFPDDMGYRRGAYVLEKTLPGLRLRLRVDGLQRNGPLRDALTRDGSVIEVVTGTDGHELRLVVEVDGGQADYHWSIDGRPQTFGSDQLAWLALALSACEDIGAMAELRGRADTLRGRVHTLSGKQSALVSRIALLEGNVPLSATETQEMASLRKELSDLRADERSDQIERELSSFDPHQMISDISRQFGSRIRELRAQIDELIRVRSV